jgi:hypothetical protein
VDATGIFPAIDLYFPMVMAWLFQTADHQEAFHFNLQ